MRISISLLSGVTFALLSVGAQAGIQVTIEDPGVQSTTATGNFTVENFDEYATGFYNGTQTPTSNIGTYTGTGFEVVAPNAYGGANKTNYFSVGAQTNHKSLSETLTIDPSKGQQGYFGFFWGAGDAKNVVKFYSQGNLVYSFSTKDVIDYINGLSNKSAYYGNPNNGEDKSEPFAFLNFYGTNGTTFDQIEFDNLDYSTGFETDNHTIATTATITGSPIPEPAFYQMGVFLASGGLLMLRRRNRK